MHFLLYNTIYILPFKMNPVLQNIIIESELSEDIIVVKKTNKPNKTNKPITQTSCFITQVARKDVLANMLVNTHLTGSQLFHFILYENKDTRDERRQGWLFETLCQILIILKCIANINYTEIYDGQLQNLKLITNINSLFKLKVEGGGNNIVDMAIKHHNTLLLFTIKYKHKYSETDVSKIDTTITKQTLATDYKIALIVKDKTLVIDHKYKNKLNIDKQLHDTIIDNSLLFDETDIIKALDTFCQRFSNNLYTVDEFCDFINADYLLSPRQQLIPKLHQSMTLFNFINSFSTNKQLMWCIAHKPRSGKSITLLLICKYLLQHGYRKILIMTSVPATIHSFTSDLDKYIDFTNIQYKTQEQFDTIDESFYGIVFCSVQYLKIDGKTNKKNLLKLIGFDAIITDESHLGSSTNKTKTDILDIDTDVDEIRQNIRLNIFASGTADKTKNYFRIHSSCVYEWAIEDEAFMKELINPNVHNKDDILQYMVNRHGPVFTQCFHNITLNQNYSKHPTQVLMKHSIPQLLIDDIITYNAKHNTNFGFSCNSLFALKQIINHKGDVVYAEEFELSKTTDGTDILKGFFDCIISTNRMRSNTIMKLIENTQSSRGSRKSTVDFPLLFIFYLPTHTRNNTISLLQKTFKQFLLTHSLWNDYNIEYSNATEDTGFVKEQYNEYITTIMNKTKTDNKKGCILLLGNKGSVGITYHFCDVTISFDDGHHLDNQKQRFSRALTEADGKTIGINVDMNVQRTYLYLIDIIHKHRTYTKTTKTNAEILYYLFEHNIFLFDPQLIHYGNLNTVDIISYFQDVAQSILTEIDDSLLLDNLICDDDMHQYIKLDFHKNTSFKPFNTDFEGDQPDCPKGDTTKLLVDAPSFTPLANNAETIQDIQTAAVEIIINQTFEMCKAFLFPLLALISRSYHVFDFKDIFTNSDTAPLILSLLKDKKIEFDEHNYYILINIMNHIIDYNSEIVNNIREIYSIAPADKLRSLIEKHFIPSLEEKKQNAEVPTPVALVDDMLDKIPIEFWSAPHSVFEPCCGKGNFVLGIFDRFYKGLSLVYPDEIQRCNVIISQCIYYADITALNVFITTEILKCHVQSYCGVDTFDDFAFHYHVGDTLLLSVADKWHLSAFDAVIGNPPYNSSGDTATGNTIWQLFTKKSINEWLLPNGYLSFVHPPGWRKPNTDKGKFTKMFDLMTKQNQMLYLEIHGIKDGQKVFNCGTRFDLYLIQCIPRYTNTIIVDEDGVKNDINLSGLNWLPNSNIIEINNMLAKGDCENCDMIYSPSAYEHRKKWMSHNKDNEFIYTCVHSTPKSGIRYMYSKVNDRGHFGISKVIIGEAGINDVIIDMDGKYGLTNGAIGIKINNIEEGYNLEKALKCNKFDKFLKSCLFSSYRVDWNLFKEFKKDFWKEFINEI